MNKLRLIGDKSIQAGNVNIIMIEDEVYILFEDDTSIGPYSGVIELLEGNILIGYRHTSQKFYLISHRGIVSTFSSKTNIQAEILKALSPNLKIKLLNEIGLHGFWSQTANTYGYTSIKLIELGAENILNKDTLTIGVYEQKLSKNHTGVYDLNTLECLVEPSNYIWVVRNGVSSIFNKHTGYVGLMQDDGEDIYLGSDFKPLVNEYYTDCKVLCPYNRISLIDGFTKVDSGLDEIKNLSSDEASSLLKYIRCKEMRVRKLIQNKDGVDNILLDWGTDNTVNLGFYSIKSLNKSEYIVTTDGGKLIGNAYDCIILLDTKEIVHKNTSYTLIFRTDGRIDVQSDEAGSKLEVDGKTYNIVGEGLKFGVDVA